MSFTSDLNQINHSISWQMAAEMVNRYNVAKQQIMNGQYGTSPEVLLNHETFNLSAVQSIMQQPGCFALRIYMGLDETSRVCLILVGVDAGGQDVITTNGVCPLPACMEEGQRFP